MIALRLLLAASLLHQSAFTAVGAACAEGRGAASRPTERRCGCCRVPAADPAIERANARPCCGTVCLCGQPSERTPVPPAPPSNTTRADELLVLPAAMPTVIHADTAPARVIIGSRQPSWPMFGLPLHRALCVWLN
ncbi:MAG: hypothetical protein HY763_02400 [Planctomycetes bacterium]|nr:hypothetical protein [Planctomycetota bacterium]